MLTFHAIEQGRWATSYPPRLFDALLARLLAAGYRALTVSQALKRVRSGQDDPGPCVCLTFDDGYASVYERAFPALQRAGMPATLFLTADRRPRDGADGRADPFLGRRMLTWDQVREMSARGIEIGAHTMTHPDLTRLPLDRVRSEVTDSKASIEDAVGCAVTSFAYPYGRFSDAVRSIVAPQFLCACSADLGFLTERSDPYAVRRLDGCYLRSEKLIALATDPDLRSRLDRYVAVRAAFRRIRRASPLLPAAS